MGQRFLFDAVLFDLDGTLIATDRFWIQAARAGARRAFEELGITRDVPSGERWMELVGHPIGQGFARLFPDLDPRQRARVLEACSEEEHRLLQAGGAALMPGARETLRALHEDGVRLGAASNCPRPYLEHMLGAALLGEWIGVGRCLDSPGVSSKADMIDDLLATFATRSALMVGDRAADRDAAWENGIPHVHCAFGFASPGEAVEAEGTIEDLAGLLELLGRRRAGIEAALEASGVLRPSVAPPYVLGVSGPPACGKSLFARDAARLLAEHGFRTALVPLEAFARGAGATDLAALAERLLEPYAGGRPAVLPLGPAPGEPPEARRELRVEPDDLVLLVGERLIDPSLRPRLDRVIHLEAADETILRRVAGRDGRRRSPGAVEELRARGLSADRAHARLYAPAGLADVVVAGDDPLRPFPLVAPAGPGG